MLKTYHTEICQRALGGTFSPRALKVIIAANLAQDGLRGQIGHPEFHFDDSAFETSYAYMQQQRQIVLDTLSLGESLLPTSARPETTPAWEAFGRLTHAAQDFYAHSNYISLWAEAHHQKELPPPTKVEALQSDLLDHPALCSGKVYLLDWLAFIPGLNGPMQRILPLDSHTHMNLDHPGRGPLFAYVLEAAIKRTTSEYEQIAKELEPYDLLRFTDS